MRHSIEEARQHYAEELRFTAKLGSRVIVDAFATVPRERFLGPGPWRVLSPMAMAEYWTTEDADPRHLYHDVLIAIDEERRLNNGQPSLWARMYDQLELSPGAHVVHVGAGTGYYSAILAELSAAPDRSAPSKSTPSSPPEPRRISRPLGRKRPS
jgi:protein-L-isoaspartate(D-aspartate) O-methyltransferase